MTSAQPTMVVGVESHAGLTASYSIGAPSKCPVADCRESFADIVGLSEHANSVHLQLKPVVAPQSSEYLSQFWHDNPVEVITDGTETVEQLEQKLAWTSELQAELHRQLQELSTIQTAELVAKERVVDELLRRELGEDAQKLVV